MGGGGLNASPKAYGSLNFLAYFHLKGFLRVDTYFKTFGKCCFSPSNALTRKGTLQLSKTECVCVCVCVFGWGGGKGGRSVSFLKSVKKNIYIAKSLRHGYEGSHRKKP